MPRENENRAGPIRGLLLPRRAWKALEREDIRNLPQLRSIEGRLEVLPGIGEKTAQDIRLKVARRSLRRRSFPGDAWVPSPWGA